MHYEVTLGPSEAKAWLSNYKADVQRPTSNAWVKRLANEMKVGGFLPDSVIQLRKLKGDTYLIDGRHRLHALVESGTEQRFVVIEDNVENEHTLLETFRKVNSGRGVTNLDYFVAAQIPEQTGLSKTQIRRLSGAIGHIAGKFAEASARDVDLDTRMTLIYRYADAVAWYFESTASRVTNLSTSLSWGAVIGVGIITFHESANVYSLEKVDAFWEGTSRMMNKYQGDPRGVAASFLMRTCPAGSNRRSAGQEPRTWAYIARYLAGCFNAWVEDRSINRIVPNVDKPIVINGSEFC